MSTAVTAAPASASCNVLPPGAAHRSMTSLAIHVTQQACRQRSRAHPESTTDHPENPAGRQCARRRCAAVFRPAGCQLQAGQPSSPVSALAETEMSSGASVRCASGDGFGGFQSEIGVPAVEQPVGGISLTGVFRGGDRRSGCLVPVDPAQDGIDKALERAPAVLACDPDGRINSGMGRGFEEHQLGDAHTQDIADAAVAARERAVQPGFDDPVDLAEIAQGRTDNTAHQRAVARGRAWPAPCVRPMRCRAARRGRERRREGHR